MKADLDTKAVLTIIAISPVWSSINIAPSVLANRQDVTDVNIVKVSNRYIGTAVPVVQE